MERTVSLAPSVPRNEQFLGVPRISIVVPVRNRPEPLRDLLNSLIRQTVPLDCFEVLICDDGSTVDFEPMLEEFRTSTALNFTLLRQVPQGPAAARNLGLRHCSAPIVAFTDSDCLPEPDWLETILGAFEDETISLVGGAVSGRKADFLSGRCVNYLMSSMLGSAGARNPNVFIHMKFFPRSSNLAVRRILAVEAGGFPNVPDTVGEDLEFSRRVMAVSTASQTRYVHKAVVEHNEKRTVRQLFQRFFDRGQTRVRLARQQLDHHEAIHALPALFFCYLFATVPASVFWPEAMLLFAIPLFVYLTSLLILAVHGAIATRSFAGVLMIPIYAFVMHFGYALGYWAALVRPLKVRLGLRFSKGPHRVA